MFVGCVRYIEDNSVYQSLMLSPEDFLYCCETGNSTNAAFLGENGVKAIDLLYANTDIPLSSDVT
jgi:hypothetical protein